MIRCYAPYHGYFYGTDGNSNFALNVTMFSLQIRTSLRRIEELHRISQPNKRNCGSLGQPSERRRINGGDCLLPLQDHHRPNHGETAQQICIGLPAL